jgi:hypothetical protein
VVFAVFVLMGALAGLAAVLTTVQFIDVQPNAGVGLELRIIAAVVVGGVAISGGRGSSLGVLLGVLLLALLGPALVFLGGKAIGTGRCRGDHPAGGGGGEAGGAERAMTDASARTRAPSACWWTVDFRSWTQLRRSTAARWCGERGGGSAGARAHGSDRRGGIDLGGSPSACARWFGWLARQPAWQCRRCRVRRRGDARRPLGGWLVASLRLPPLIVARHLLLYRIRGGATGGVANYTGFPDGFLGLGQGTFFGGIPAQLPLLAVAFLFQARARGHRLCARGRARGVPVGARRGSSTSVQHRRRCGVALTWRA